MTILDSSHMSTEQRVDLIGELCDSIDRDAVPLTDAQAAEIDRRLAMLDEEPGERPGRFRGLGRPSPPLPLCASPHVVCRGRLDDAVNWYANIREGLAVRFLDEYHLGHGFNQLHAENGVS